MSIECSLLLSKNPTIQCFMWHCIWAWITELLCVIIISLRGKYLHVHVKQQWWPSCKSRVQLKYIISKIRNNSMTHGLITSFLTYLDNIINNVPSHFWLPTLSHIIFDHLLAQSYRAAYLCVSAHKCNHTYIRYYRGNAVHECALVCVWYQSKAAQLCMLRKLRCITTKIILIYESRNKM